MARSWSAWSTTRERRSRFTMLVMLRNKEPGTVTKALQRHVRKLPTELRWPLTWDRGMEMAYNRDFTVATDVKVYFCDPQSPWQRGTNENRTRLLRQYFPKGTDLAQHSQADLNRNARQLNERPRKTLAYDTPAATRRACVALTG